MHLFISDLDGTLLNSKPIVSDFTVKTINNLIKNSSLIFSISTARSLDSAWPLINEIDFHYPIILHNGAFIYDSRSGKYLVKNTIPFADVKKLVGIIAEFQLNPIIYSTNSLNENWIFYTGIHNSGEEDYFYSRKQANDKRLCLTEQISFSELFEAISINIIDIESKLLPLYNLLKQEKLLYCHFGKDIYSGFYWLEITNLHANKKSALQTLKKLLNATTTSAFGDNLNDLPMFEEADYRYPVSNAHELLKANCTSVIASNNDDGVAKFLLGYFKNNSCLTTS